MNWRLIIFSAGVAAVGFNVLILLLVVGLFLSGIFHDQTIIRLQEYLIPFALFSPLLASFVSCAVVTHFSRSKKIPHVILSTFVTFALTTLILFSLTAPFAIAISDNFDRRVNKADEKGE